MSSQKSIFHYVPQPYYIDDTPAIANSQNVDSIDNSGGIFTPDLSDYTTLNNYNDTTFTAGLGFDKLSSYLSNVDVTVALIGCALLTYENSGGNPVLETEFSENIYCQMAATNLASSPSYYASFVHNPQDSVRTIGGVSLPSVISGGRSNIIFNGLGKSASGTSLSMGIKITRKSADVSARPHAKFIIGHLFIGVDLPVIIDPNSYSWSMEVENNRFNARDYGAVNSDGTLVRRSTGEIIRVGNYDIIGTEITGVGSPITETHTATFLEMLKTNVSYPVLLNPYPAGAVLDSSKTVAQANLTARQNFFSIYGFLQGGIELGTDAYRDGLDSQYRARYRITETR